MYPPLRHLALVLTLLPAVAGAGLLDRSQRELFLAAEQALEKKDDALFQLLSAPLRHYPLYPYLEYQRLVGSLEQADRETVRDFLQRHADTPLAPRLRARWLDLLARRKQWEAYLAFYRDDGNVRRRCHRLQALLETDRRAQALNAVPRLWLSGRSRPKACDPVFDAWRQAGGLTPERIWKRLALAMDAGQLGLARYLRKQLPKTERPLADLWLEAARRPGQVTEDRRLPRKHAMKAALLSYAVRRQATLDPLAALELWPKAQRLARFTPAEHDRILRRLVSALLRNPDPRAWAFIRSARPRSGDTILQQTRLRAALLRQAWPSVLAWIGALPASLQQSERWRYWKARALEQLGHEKAARVLYDVLAGARSFYGFLAADRVQAPYHLDHRPLQVDPQEVKRLEARPALQRTRELVALERWTDARREWRLLTRNLSRKATMAAAWIARQWNWHDQAIFTLARTGYWDDLDLRFPLEHRRTVAQQARKWKLDLAWVFGLIRQESAFNPLVRSHAGAIGLMQLMPATARYVARRLLKRHHTPKRRDLVDPDTNIELGTTYLSDVLQRLSGNPVLATAAYNAGPRRVLRWLPETALPADIWIESIPFTETRRYVQRVFTYAVIYDHRLGRTPQRLSNRLQPVNPAVSQQLAMKTP